MNTPVIPPVMKPFKLHQADDNRRKRRALVKAVGKRQFKKLYRKAQV
jgi:hypothetical protein